MYDRRSTASSIMDFLYLNPLPLPLLLVFFVISLFLGIKFYVSYESVVEATEESMGWFIMAAPVVILVVLRLLSAVDDNIPGAWIFGSSPFDRHRRMFYEMPSEGSSPWGVAAVILLLLVLVQYQSSFLENWFA